MKEVTKDLFVAVVAGTLDMKDAHLVANLSSSPSACFHPVQGSKTLFTETSLLLGIPLVPNKNFTGWLGMA